MGRRSLFLLLTAGALLLAAGAWVAAALGRQFPPGREQALVRRGCLEDSLPLTGVVLRRETPLENPRSRSELLVPEGQRRSAGTPLAILYDSGEEYFRAALLLRLREEAAPDRSGEEALDAYRAALARRDLAALPSAARGLGQSLGLPGSVAPSVLAQEIDALSRGQEELLLSPAAGFFSASPDGWEELDPRRLTPSVFKECLAAPDAPGGGIGKLIYGSEWSFCALVPGAEAARFSPGQALLLRLPDGTDCAARVGSVVTQGSDTLVTLRSREHLEKVLSLRRTELTAVFTSYRGLLLPAAALREEAGAYTVRRAGLPLGGVTPVTLLFCREDTAVVLAPGLREGMAVELGP